MDFQATSVFYLALGACVAVAVYVRDRARSSLRRAVNTVAAVPFWPLFLPFLLAPSPVAANTSSTVRENLAHGIDEVARELGLARNALADWPTGRPSVPDGLTQEVIQTLNERAQRIADMDAVLAPLPPAATALAEDTSHAERLRAIRDRALTEFAATLAWTRELLALLHLARFTGAPPARAEEIARQLLDAVRGLSSAS